MSETTTTIGVQLSTHEAWSLMRLMKLPGIPGLPLPPSNAVPEEALRAADQLALGSLRARGLVQLRDEGDSSTLVIDKATGALLGAGALCDYYLTLSAESTSDAELFTYVYFGPHLSVIHSQPQPDLHLLSAATSGDVLFSAIYSGLALENLNSSSRAFRVEIDPQSFEEMAKESEDGVAQQLADIGLKPVDARRLAVALHDVKRRASRQEMRTQAVTGIQILTDGAAYFVCTPQHNGVRIETANTPQVIDAVMRLIY